MDRDRNILKSAALAPQHLASQPEQEAMPQTLQELAALCLRNTPEHLLSKKDKRCLFAMESWPSNVPIKTQDKLQVLKIFNRIREAIGL